MTLQKPYVHNHILSAHLLFLYYTNVSVHPCIAPLWYFTTLNSKQPIEKNRIHIFWTRRGVPGPDNLTTLHRHCFLSMTVRLSILGNPKRKPSNCELAVTSYSLSRSKVHPSDFRLTVRHRRAMPRMQLYLWLSTLASPSSSLRNGIDLANPWAHLPSFRACARSPFSASTHLYSIIPNPRSPHIP